MNIAMIGAGYVGLTTGACLAELGHRVCCIDVDAVRIDRLLAGGVPIFEPGLEPLIGRNLQAERLSFSTQMEAVEDADAVFLAVGTPSRADGSINLAFLDSAARQIAPFLMRDAVVVIKSTVVAGTARRLREIIAEARGALDFSVASNPEFLREGSAVDDFMHPDRIVIGTDDGRAAKLLEGIYSKLIAEAVAWVATSTTNAELIKYAANAMLALKIGFINEIADLCEVLGGDAGAVALGIGLDRRIGPAFLAPGPGFGGSCFPKDTRALAALGRQHGAPQAIIETLIERNERRKQRIAETILSELRPGHRRVAVLGVAFKANTDDVRESAALTIVPVLQQAGCEVTVHDPKARAEDALPGASWDDDPYDAAENADLVVILTEWPEYRSLDLVRLSEVMRGETLIDTRNLLDPATVESSGLHYLAVGRGTSSKPSRRRGHAAGPASVARIVASSP
jgi:UDPglucose 6-dehydrogenase